MSIPHNLRTQYISTYTGIFTFRDVSQLHAEKHKLLAKSGGAAIGFYPDDGTGTKGIYQILSRFTNSIFKTNKIVYENFYLIMHAIKHQFFTEIYRIEDFDMVPINDENLYGKFFGGDSYVIRYTYQNSDGRDAYIVYFWQVCIM